MATKPDENEVAQLLRHILVIQLWRGGLTQAQIRKRLGLSTNTVNDMLKGMSRSVSVRMEGAE